MSTSVQRIPCAPPPDWSEPRHTRQSPPSTLRSTVALDVSSPPPSRPTLKISICFPSLFALSPSMNSKNVHGGWWQSKDRAGTQVRWQWLHIGEMLSSVTAAASPLPPVAHVSPCTFFWRFFLKKTKQNTNYEDSGGGVRRILNVCVCECVLDVCTLVEVG